MFAVLVAQDAGGGSAVPSLIFLGLMVGVFYLLIIRPQRKRSAAQREMAAALSVGDDIRTIGGIHGTVVSMDEESVVLKVEDGRIRVSKRAIGSRAGEDA